MSKASIYALQFQQESGKLKTDKDYILKWIELRTDGGDGTTILDLEMCLTMKMSTITARLSDLEDAGAIYKNGEEDVKVGSDTYKYSKYYFEPNEIKRADNRQKVKAAKYKLRVEGLIKTFPDFISPQLKSMLEDSLSMQTTLNL